MSRRAFPTERRARHVAKAGEGQYIQLDRMHDSDAPNGADVPSPWRQRSSAPIVSFGLEPVRTWDSERRWDVHPGGVVYAVGRDRDGACVLCSMPLDPASPKSVAVAQAERWFAASGYLLPDGEITRRLRRAAKVRTAADALESAETPVDERNEQIAKLRRAGLSQRSIAERTGLPKSTVADIVKRLDIGGSIVCRDGRLYPARRPNPKRPVAA